MNLTQLHLRNLGQIREANLELGDLTVFVGPQATGKSIALQMLKLLVDRGPIRSRLEQYGVDWEGKLPAFLDSFLGEGMHGIWREETKVPADGADVDLSALIKKKGPRKDAGSVFFIPAQKTWRRRAGVA